MLYNKSLKHLFLQPTGCIPCLCPVWCITEIVGEKEDKLIEINAGMCLEGWE